jgi:hypothetical protein
LPISCSSAAVLTACTLPRFLTSQALAQGLLRTLERAGCGWARFDPSHRSQARAPRSSRDEARISAVPYRAPARFRTDRHGMRGKSQQPLAARARRVAPTASTRRPPHMPPQMRRPHTHGRRETLDPFPHLSFGILRDRYPGKSGSQMILTRVLMTSLFRESACGCRVQSARH